MKTDTIAAIATAMSNSGIGIVRISGDEALEVADSSKKGKPQGFRYGDTYHPLWLCGRR